MWRYDITSKKRPDASSVQDLQNEKTSRLAKGTTRQEAKVEGGCQT
jgi:hypothetical protein